MAVLMWVSLCPMTVGAAALELHEIPDFQKHVADEVRASMMSEDDLVSEQQPPPTT